MNTKILSLIMIFAVSIIFTVNNAYAQNVITELSGLTDNCTNYANIVKNSSIREQYPEFDEEKNKYSEKTIQLDKKIYTYKYIPLKKAESTGKTYKVRIYDFKDCTTTDIYNNLRHIINQTKTKKIILRKNMSDKDAEDRVELTESKEIENAGFTCYINKDSNEYWIKTKPTKTKEAVFIIDSKNKKLYHRENILNDEY